MNILSIPIVKVTKTYVNKIVHEGMYVCMYVCVYLHCFLYCYKGLAHIVNFRPMLDTGPACAGVLKGGTHGSILTFFFMLLLCLLSLRVEFLLFVV